MFVAGQVLCEEATFSPTVISTLNEAKDCSRLVSVKWMSQKGIPNAST